MSTVEHIVQEFAGHLIRQREDGYMNATDMCKISPKKKPADYFKSKQVELFLEALAVDVKIPASKLVHSAPGRGNVVQGTWIHPKVAIHMAQWISPEFAVKVVDWVFRYMMGDLSLVGEIVSQHDRINGVESRVLIESYDRQLIEHKEQIEALSITNNKLTSTNEALVRTTTTLQDRIEGLNKLTCPYCSKMYSNNSGLTSHIRNKCEEKDKKAFLAIIDFHAFKTFMDLVVEDWLELQEVYGFSIEKANWNTNNPLLIVKYGGGKEYKYKITNNSSRVRILTILNTHRSIPINLLVDKNAMTMFNNNSDILKIVHDFKECDMVIKADELESALNPDNEVDEDEEF